MDVSRDQEAKRKKLGIKKKGRPAGEFDTRPRDIQVSCDGYGGIFRIYRIVSYCIDYLRHFRLVLTKRDLMLQAFFIYPQRPRVCDRRDGKRPGGGWSFVCLSGVENHEAFYRALKNTLLQRPSTTTAKSWYFLFPRLRIYLTLPRWDTQSRHNLSFPFSPPHPPLNISR